MTVPRVLLLSQLCPGDVEVGRLFLRQLCLFYPRDKIVCVHTDPAGEKYKSPDLAWLPTRWIEPPRERGAPYGQTVARAANVLAERWREMTALRRWVRRAAQFGREHRVDLVCSPLHSPTTLRAALALAESLHAPLIPVVWDPPAYNMRKFLVDRFTMRRLLAQFDQAMRAAVRCGVASEGMKRAYEKKYGTECVVLIFGQQRVPAAPPAQSEPVPRHPAKLVIGVAGSLYAEDEWQAMLHALAERDWRIAGREVVVRVIGISLAHRYTCPVNIEFLGPRTPVETLRLLSGMDVGYVPYWFAEQYREVVEVTFPSKMAAYVAAGLPVLYHGPRYAAVSSFIDRYPLGLQCHSLDHEEITGSLERLATDPDTRLRARTACDDAYREELNAAVLRRRFAQLLGVGERDLPPMDCGG